MKLLTRMMLILSFFVMVQNVYAAGNNVYVDQIGDGSTINITQTGNSNAVGNATVKATFNGQNNIDYRHCSAKKLECLPRPVFD